MSTISFFPYTPSLSLITPHSQGIFHSHSPDSYPTQPPHIPHLTQFYSLTPELTSSLAHSLLHSLTLMLSSSPAQRFSHWITYLFSAHMCTLVFFHFQLTDRWAAICSDEENTTIIHIYPLLFHYWPSYSERWMGSRSSAECIGSKGYVAALWHVRRARNREAGRENQAEINLQVYDNLQLQSFMQVI